MFFTKTFVLLSVLAFVSFTETRHLKKDEDSPLWWQTTAIYQIYPRSFKDSDNDGVGDLKGIVDKLHYLQETGIGAVWLSPIYPSPWVDFGYDITDFKNISPIFGTLDDFDELVKQAHDLGLKIILDFVPGYTSDLHEWFQKSVNREPGYEDYYVWLDPKGFDEDGNPIPPNNWVSEFRGSAWEYNEQRKQFYLHTFTKEQPDLNYRSPKLVQDMKEVLVFWMERGVDGFRIDAIDHLFEDDRFLDEPVAYPEIEDHLDIDYLVHVYTKNVPETYDMVQQWREVVDQQSAIDGIDRFITVEIYATMDKVVPYYGTEDRPGAHFPFNFRLIEIGNGTTAKDFKMLIDDWFDNIPNNKQSDWVIGNHDRHRIGSKVGSDLIDGMNALVTLLPGTSVTYYGEEIGMLDNTDITYEEGLDPLGCNYPPEEFASRTRDFERTPMQWDSSTNAGFNEGEKTWLPINSNYLTVNVENEKADPYSHYLIYKDLIRARQWRVVRQGKVLVSEVGKGTLAILRSLNSEEFLIVLINISHEDEVLDLDFELLISSDKNLTVYTASKESALLKNSTVPANNVPLAARGSAVLIYGISELNYD